MSFSRRLSTCVLALFVAVSAMAQNNDEHALTPEREAAALTFAKRHHRELYDLLTQLKEMDSKGYESALTELFRTSERIARYKSRTPDRYETEIELWKIDSRVRLLIARSARGMEEETRSEIKTLLMQRNAIRAAQLQRDRDKLQERLTKLDEQITELSDSSEVIADRELDRLMKSAKTRQSPRNANTTANRPTPKKSPVTSAGSQPAKTNQSN